MRVEKALNSFGKEVVQQSRTRLTKTKKNASKSLYNSIGYKAKESKRSFELSFQMEDYGTFVDKGVKGVGGKRADGTNWKKKVVVNSPFRYKDKRPPAKAFDKWIVLRGFAPRNKKGQFVSRKSLGFAIANSVYHTGLETTNFFTKSFDLAFKKLPNDIVDAFGLDVDDLLKFSLK